MIDLTPLYGALVGLAITALGGLVAMLPKAWRYLVVQINGADALLLRNALDNIAMEQAVDVESGRVAEEAALTTIRIYVKKNLPSALARLNVPDQTLDTMARAALARAILAVEASHR